MINKFIIKKEIEKLELFDELKSTLIDGSCYFFDLGFNCCEIVVGSEITVRYGSGDYINQYTVHIKNYGPGCEDITDIKDLFDRIAKIINMESDKDIIKISFDIEEILDRFSNVDYQQVINFIDLFDFIK